MGKAFDAHPLRIAILAGLIGVAAVAVLVAAASTSTANGGVALLDPRTQGVFVRTVGMGNETRAGDIVVLHAGDAVRTDEGGRAFITYADGTILVLEPETELVIDVRGGGSDLLVLITQNAGRVWYQLSRTMTPSARFEVHSGSLAAVVRAGSALQVAVNDDGADLTVATGSVETTANGETVTVVGGSRTTVQSGATPAPVELVTITPPPLPEPLYQWPWTPTSISSGTSTAAPAPIVTAPASPTTVAPSATPAPTAATPTATPVPPSPSAKTKPTSRPKTTPSPMPSPTPSPSP